MSDGLPIEREAFNAFLDQRFVVSGTDATLEQALAAFRAYQRDLEHLKQKLQPSIEQADRGEARPLDHDSLMQRVRDRIDQHGIR
jgi:hypothetical protein